MTAWPTVTLESLSAPFRGAITDGPFGSNLTSAHYTEAGPQVVRLQNIGDGVYNQAPAHISEEHFESLRKHEVLGGDLVVASLGQQLPRACLVPETVGPAIVKADCIRVRLKHDVDPRWVMYALRRPEARRWAEQHLHGVGRPRLGLKLIKQIPVPLPSLDVQRRIVELLETHLSRLEDGCSSVAQSADRLLALRQSLRKSAIERLKGETVPLGELVAKIEAGRSLGKSAPSATESEWGIIKVSAMTWGEFRPDENKRIPAHFADPRYEIRRGDLLVSRANTSAYVGASVVVGDVRPRLLLSDKSLRLVPKRWVNPWWLNEVLQSPSVRAQISALATGTKDSMRNISQGALLSVQVPKASAQEQAAMLQHLESLALAVERLEVELERARHQGQQLQRALLSAAFSGRLTKSSHGVDVEEGALAG